MLSITRLGYLSLIVFIVVYIFAVVGLDTFQDEYENYYTEKEMPRLVANSAVL